MKRIFLFLSLSSVLSISAAQWSQFRGPNGAGKTDANLPIVLGEGKNVKWKTPMPGKAWSSPVVWGNQIWFTNAEADGHKLWAVCLDAATGKVLHNKLVFEIAKPQKSPVAMNSYASPTPVVEAGRVYVSFGAHGTACLDTQTAKVIWQRQDEQLYCDHFRLPASSPILHGGTVILQFDGADKQFVVALNKKDGKTKWLHKRAFDFGTDNGDRKKGYGTPSLIATGDRLQLITPAAVATEALDPNTGKLLWTARTGGMNASGLPQFAHGLVFVNNGMGSMSAIRPSGKGDLEAAWSSRRNIAKKSSMLVHGDYIYMVADNGVATCLEAKTGKPIWSERLKAGEFAASPILCGDRIYCFGIKGDVVVFSAQPKFKILSRGKYKSGFMATPAVTGNALILRTKTAVYRVEGK
ncbi:MAG TPA: quinonprotein alcohol dehydrogenase [Verrucomicrobiales bacterium]|nr:quinonprotein alcohol dehydrogenase [Verrucomicrobiales bacterium]